MSLHDLSVNDWNLKVQIKQSPLCPASFQLEKKTSKSNKSDSEEIQVLKLGFGFRFYSLGRMFISAVLVVLVVSLQVLKFGPKKSENISKQKNKGKEESSQVISHHFIAPFVT